MAEPPEIERSPEGFFRLKGAPERDKLAAFYEHEYFGHSRGNYRPSYSPEEAAYFRNKIDQKRTVIERLHGAHSSGYRRLLDLGCGEGWSLARFAEHGWDVTGVDYTRDAVLDHNPEMADRVVVGELIGVLERLRAAGSRFDAVMLRNVLEHVPNPGELLSACHEVAAPAAVLVVEVPNDFSAVQRRLLETGAVDRPFWVVAPDHINYFGADSLARLCAAHGWVVARTIADYPIDWHLFDPDSNYVRHPERGSGAHAARVQVENLLHELSLDGAIDFFSELARLGGGRQITLYLTRHGAGYAALPGGPWREAAYVLEPIRRQDMLDIKRWRNDQIGILRQSTSLSDADQLSYWENVVLRTFTSLQPRMILFSYLSEGDCIGYGGLTNIDWDAGRAEVSFVAETARYNDEVVYQKDLSVFLRLIRRIAFDDLRLRRLLTETFDVRPRHVALLEAAGFVLEGRMRSHARVGSELVDSLIHGLLNPNPA